MINAPVPHLVKHVIIAIPGVPILGCTCWYIKNNPPNVKILVLRGGLSVNVGKEVLLCHVMDCEPSAVMVLKCIHARQLHRSDGDSKAVA